MKIVGVDNNKFNFLLIAFCLVEVLIFKANESIALIASLGFYAFVFAAFLKKNETGIFYFLSFTLLSVGIGNYSGFEELPNNFWGIRLFGFSFNIIFSIVLFCFCLVGRNKMPFRDISSNDLYSFLFIFTLYNIVLGIISLGFATNYLDNFINDCLTYLPFILYVLFISILSPNTLYKIFIQTGVASVFLLFFAFLFSKRFQYGDGEFLVQNTVCTMLPLTILLFRDSFGKLFKFLAIAFIAYSVISSNFFISGKLWIMFFLLMFFLLFQSKKYRIFTLPVGLFLILLLGPLFDFLLVLFSGTVMEYKLLQVHSIFNISSIISVSQQESSIGNLVAEARTIFVYIFSNPLVFVFGKGFGGGVPDVLSLLGKWVGLEGYAKIDVTRNNFYKMHLPLLELLVKSGVFFTFFYLNILRKSLVLNNKFSIVFLFLFFMFFYVSKEYLLYTLIVYKLLIHEKEAAIILNKKLL